MISRTFFLRDRSYKPGVPKVVLSSLFLVLLLCCTPALRSGKFISIPGNNRHLPPMRKGRHGYYPGDKFEMTIILTNKGRDTAMEVAPLLSAGAYDPRPPLG